MFSLAGARQGFDSPDGAGLRPGQNSTDTVRVMVKNKRL